MQKNKIDETVEVVREREREQETKENLFIFWYEKFNKKYK